MKEQFQKRPDQSLREHLSLMPHSTLHAKRNEIKKYASVNTSINSDNRKKLNPIQQSLM
jgi:hypothetical protein